MRQSRLNPEILQFKIGTEETFIIQYYVTPSLKTLRQLIDDNFDLDKRNFELLKQRFKTLQACKHLHFNVFCYNGKYICLIEVTLEIN